MFQMKFLYVCRYLNILWKIFQVHFHQDCEVPILVTFPTVRDWALQKLLRSNPFLFVDPVGRPFALRIYGPNAIEQRTSPCAKLVSTFKRDTRKPCEMLVEREQLGAASLCAIIATSHPRCIYYFEKQEFPMGYCNIPVSL